MKTINTNIKVSFKYDFMGLTVYFTQVRTKPINQMRQQKIYMDHQDTHMKILAFSCVAHVGAWTRELHSNRQWLS